jgi:hypothetical protein
MITADVVDNKSVVADRWERKKIHNVKDTSP